MSLSAAGAYTLWVGTAEFGNGTSTVHAQLAATELNTTSDRIVLRQSDTDVAAHDTGAFGSAGTVVAGKAVQTACAHLRTTLLASAAALAGVDPSQCELGPNGVQCGDRLIGFAELVGDAPMEVSVATTAHRDRWPSTCRVFGWRWTPRPAWCGCCTRCRPPTPVW